MVDADEKKTEKPRLVQLDEAMEHWWNTGYVSTSENTMCIALYCIAKDIAEVNQSLKKLVSIAPWYKEGEYAGFALIIIDLPPDMRNIVKD